MITPMLHNYEDRPGLSQKEMTIRLRSMNMSSIGLSKHHAIMYHIYLALKHIIALKHITLCTLLFRFP